MDLTTSDLLARAGAGAPRAGGQILGRCRVPLTRFAHGRLPAHARDLIDTDDLVQMAMLRGLEKMDGFVPRHEGAFLAYLRRILLNHILDELRRYARRPKRIELAADLIAA